MKFINEVKVLNFKETIDSLKTRIRFLESKIQETQKEIERIQSSCPHENMEEYMSAGSYGGPPSQYPSIYKYCSDCGYKRIENEC